MTWTRFHSTRSSGKTRTVFFFTNKSSQDENAMIGVARVQATKSAAQEENEARASSVNIAHKP